MFHISLIKVKLLRDITGIHLHLSGTTEYLSKVCPSLYILTCNVCVRIAPHPYSHLLLFFNLATIFGKEFYLVVIWTCIFLIINDIECSFNTYLPFVFLLLWNLRSSILFCLFLHCINLILSVLAYICIIYKYICVKFWNYGSVNLPALFLF